MHSLASASRPRAAAVVGLAAAAVTLPLLATSVLAGVAVADSPAPSARAEQPRHGEAVVEEMGASRANVQTKKRGRYSITAPKKVTQGARYTTTATVPVKKKYKRPVKVQQRTTGSWKTLKQVRVSKQGRLTVVVRATKTGRVKLRAVAPKVKRTRTRAAQAQYVSPTLSVKVVAPAQKTPAPAPAPKPTATPTPTVKPTPAPTTAPTATPTVRPTALPTVSRPPVPTPVPTKPPTATPTPTKAPTVPTAKPTPTPTAPTVIPGDPGGGWDPAEYVSPTGLFGSASDWGYLTTGAPIGWDACTPVTWSYDPAGAYQESLADLKRSFARVAGISGLKFKYVGGADADITVRWKPSTAFGGSTIGTAYTSYTSTWNGPWRITRSTISFNYDYPLSPGVEPADGLYAVGQLFQHEIMHAVGLNHASEPTQLMYPSISRQAPRFGAGDHAGLTQVGQVHPC